MADRGSLFFFNLGAMHYRWTHSRSRVFLPSDLREPHQMGGLRQFAVDVAPQMAHGSPHQVSRTQHTWTVRPLRWP